MALHNIADKWILQECYLVFEQKNNNRINSIYVVQRLCGLKLDFNAVYKPLSYTALDGLYRTHKLLNDNDLYFDKAGDVYKEVTKFSMDDFLKHTLDVQYQDCPKYYNCEILGMSLDIRYGSVTAAINNFFEAYYTSMSFTFKDIEFLDTTLYNIPCVMEYGQLGKLA